MARKKIDPRIKTLIELNVSNHHRSLFVMIGDHGRDQIIHLHYMLSKAQVCARPSVLWCYKKELGFSSNKKKRMRMLEDKKKKGISLNDVANEDNLFDRFLSTTDIRYCYYKESEKILGNTFGMCDFEALTPNLLARTIETVRGGGMIVLLLNNINSLRQLYTMTMDVHSRYRTEGTKDQDIVGRFNERFLLSLSRCDSCLFIDDSLNVLPITSFSRNMLSSTEDGVEKDPSTLQEQENSRIKDMLDKLPEVDGVVRTIGNLCKTVDQTRALISIAEAISAKSLRFTLSLTASRGRGKSAALGLAMAVAVSQGFSNIFVTSPSPSNLGTLFSFLFKGLEALGYNEHTHYDAIQATSEELSGITVRVNIFKTHRQTIQYIAPEDFRVLGQAELVVIDEAAAIPLPLVKSLLGPYLVLLSSTIHGYEGTGRSLSLKLIQQLREQQGGSSGRFLKEIKLEAPIRYARKDLIEEWLNKLLCFDAVGEVKKSTSPSCPHPKDCQLFYVNRDTLFSFHEASETFLQKMMFLYVSSHYKNTPNDLQLMSDAPAHHLFVLLGPASGADEDCIPEILCVLQVCIEGSLSRESILKSISRGQRGGGDLIPWTISTQFQDTEFASLSGARIIRIATHPELQKMGYGTRAITLLEQYYRGEMFSDERLADPKQDSPAHSNMSEETDLESLCPRANLPPLLYRLDERAPERLDWVGVSFGLTQSLAKFWKRLGFLPVYVRQTKNDLTGENTVIMLKNFVVENPSDWLKLFFDDFYCRFYNLLPMAFRDMPIALALELMQQQQQQTHNIFADAKDSNVIELLSKFDIRRLEAYLSNTADFHVILDLIPTIARAYFFGKLSLKPSDSLTPVQSGILLSIGGQMKSIDDLENILGLNSSQLLAMLSKILKKFFNIFRGHEENRATRSLQTTSDVGVSQANPNTSKRSLSDEAAWDPTPQSLDEDLRISALSANSAFRSKQQELIDSLDISKYAIDIADEQWSSAVDGKKNLSKSSTLAVQKESKKQSGRGYLKTLQEIEAKKESRRVLKCMSKSEK
ncbi:tRNA(Met) cytidine acetyltransferase [Mitosporidium daphniae]|uniref:RNA cytidine acetyltransferase n=1 Tax=Mitosporidium daphniae TaxID=1485682 RepID=A0A098VPJ3_9MICR|nr:tRNA(Met) cytidine acetyltransferase [Mitosporidium daphniae]KGG50933.1 tRNA(Met) cytidine acetyltransferase [Mitosporidium daphniae]|eukprot:XP_013237360.1 tRNA(Met) cytidine acetyltransferase [Mitosporidium daphniae]